MRQSRVHRNSKIFTSSINKNQILFKQFLQDHELWMDFNVTNKVMTFVAISVINRKDNVFGMASASEIELVS